MHHILTRLFNRKSTRGPAEIAAPAPPSAAARTAPPATEDSPLLRSEERLRLMVEAVRDYAIFMLDPHGLVVTWNLGAERIKGYAAADIIGKHFSVFYTPEANRNRWPDHELTVAADKGRFEDEGWRVRKDGSRFWANVIITAIRDKAGTLQGFAKVTRDLTERRKADQLIHESHQRLDQRVRERTAELTRLAQALQDEITERERLEAELRRRVEELHQSHVQKNTFLAMLSHELRNPLAGMRNALHLLQSGSPERGEAHRATAILARQLDHLVRLVNDLMDVTRIVQDRIELRREPIDLAEAVRMALETARPAIEAQRQRLEVTIPPTPVPVQGDMVRLTQVFSNLLLNAAKYTDPGGDIRLEVERMSGHALVRVWDTGIGIHPELQDRVFDLFVQGRPSIDRSKGGLGVGLTLVRRLVEMHDGSVHVHSQGPGKGSEFSVRLPLLRSAGTEARPSSSTQQVAVSSRRVLVVDDNQDAADTLAAIMRAAGHLVQVSYDGLSALEAARHFSPDLVLLDIGLPGMNGYDVARRLREELSGRSLALIAITGYGQEEDKRRAKEAGFDAHLIKPVDFQLLEAILDR